MYVVAMGTRTFAQLNSLEKTGKLHRNLKILTFKHLVDNLTMNEWLKFFGSMCMHNSNLTAYIEWQTSGKKRKGRKCLSKHVLVQSIVLIPGIAVFDCGEGDLSSTIHIMAFFDVDKE